MKFKNCSYHFSISCTSAALIGCSGGDTSTGSQTTDSSVTATTNASLKILLLKLKNLLLSLDIYAAIQVNPDISSMYGIDLNDVAAFAGEIDSTGLRTDEFLIIEAKTARECRPHFNKNESTSNTKNE